MQWSHRQTIDPDPIGVPMKHVSGIIERRRAADRIDFALNVLGILFGFLIIVAVNAPEPHDPFSLNAFALLVWISAAIWLTYLAAFTMLRR